MKPLQIYACGQHYQAVSEPLPDMKSLTQQVTGKSIRRIGRFIQLALIGATRCRAQQQLPADTAVYLASGRGDLELTLEIMTQLFREGQSPKPLSFVNTVSNAACFYIAQLLGLQSRSNFVCNRYFAFESVLQLAALDLQLGVVDSALVGSVDIATAPLSEHRQRLQLAPDTAIGEGSHWLWLGVTDAQRPRLGQLLAARHFAALSDLLHWITTQHLSSELDALAVGQFVSATDEAALQRATELPLLHDLHTRAYYDSHSGAILQQYLESTHPARQLLYVNTDTGQRYSVILIRR